MTADASTSEQDVDPRSALLERPTATGAGGHSARGIVWNVGANGLSYAIRLASIPVLARLLSPDDYGLVAIVTATTGLVGVIGLTGVSELVIQKRELTHRQATLMFWGTVGLCAVLTVLTAASAPLLAAGFGRAELVAITVAVASTFLITGIGQVHKALMRRRLLHKAVAIRELIAIAGGIAASVVAAFLGAGYWALVIQMLVQSTVSTVLALVSVPWRPGRPRRDPQTREMVKFGGGVSVYKIMNYLGLNADNIVIGAFTNASSLGLYTRAYGLLTAPLQQVHAPVGLVVTPTLAALWPEPERYRRYFLTVLAGLCYVCMPVVLILAVLSEHVVGVMLGDRWSQAADVFRWLAVVGFLQTVGWTNGWLYATSGQTWRWARWGLISRSVIVASFFVGVPWGIEGVAAAYAAVELVLTPLGIWRAGRGTPVSLRDVLATVVRPVVLAVTMAAAALLTTVLLHEAAVAELALGLLVAGAAGALLVLAWPGARREVIGMVQRLRQRA